MIELDNLKASAKRLARAISAAGDLPTPVQIDGLIDSGCDVVADAIKLVKAIWKP